MDGGVVRKIGKGEEISEMVKGGDVEEVQLHGAWVTPGRSISPVHSVSHSSVSPFPHFRTPFAPQALTETHAQVSSICTRTSESIPPHRSRERTTPTPLKPQFSLGSDPSTASTPTTSLSTSPSREVSRHRWCFLGRQGTSEEPRIQSSPDGPPKILLNLCRWVFLTEQDPHTDNLGCSAIRH
jgi:hypothetical protein